MMRHFTIITLLTIAVGCSKSSTTATPVAKAPTTKPSVVAAAPSNGILPAEYAILQTHNAFVRGGMAGGPEAGMVFRGTVQADGALLAFIEDTATRNLVQAKAGQMVGSGQVKSISLDSIVYVLGGEEKHIEIGQTLTGQPAPPPPGGPEQGAPPPPEQMPQMPPGMPPGMMQQIQRARRQMVISG